MSRTEKKKEISKGEQNVEHGGELSYHARCDDPEEAVDHGNSLK